MRSFQKHKAKNKHRNYIDQSKKYTNTVETVAKESGKIDALSFLEVCSRNSLWISYFDCSRCNQW